MSEALSQVGAALGIGQDELGLVQMSLRALVVYLSALVFVRLGEKRFFGKSTAFDLILAIILGSVASRAINGSAPLLATLAAGATLIAVHWLLAAVSFHLSPFGTLIKGRPRTLIRGGEVDRQAMRRSHLSDHDLETALRQQAGLRDPGAVEEARLERSGDISVIPRPSEPKVVDVAVHDGVQTVRIRIDGS